MTTSGRVARWQLARCAATREADSRRLVIASLVTTGFTLIELMMVVAIVGLMMATGVPAILSVTREAPMRKAVNDVMEICRPRGRRRFCTGRRRPWFFIRARRQVELERRRGRVRAWPRACGPARR